MFSSEIIISTPATFWQKLSTDIISLETSYGYYFRFDLDSSARRIWCYVTYIKLSNGGARELGESDSSEEALRFHNEMALKHGFIEEKVDNTTSIC